jgi:eukaryotic-like serine/threonine-protein kinase
MAEFSEIQGYEVLATLGVGARSTIYAVKDSKNRLFALKRVVKSGPSDQRFVDQAISEHEVAQKFDHPVLRKSIKLIKQRNFIRTSEVLVLMEMVDGSTLEKHQPDNLADLCHLCREVCQGLGVMHKGGYVHADIKPNNIMITDEGHIKIIDFGRSCPTGTVKDRIQGTPDYIAPEQVQRRSITPQTDVFNLGATLYWLLTSKHVPTLIPKGAAGISLQTKDACKTPMELNPDVPPALSSLVMDCIHTDLPKRPETMALVADRLEIAARQFQRRENNGDDDSDKNNDTNDAQEPNGAGTGGKRSAS